MDAASLPIVVVVGAGRSGTNLLAGVLDEEPTLHNCVESRYIWNIGQKTMSHDVRPREDATPRVAGFIRDHFARIAERTGCTPVDKTPSNVFRVAFIKAIFPNALIIHIIRDGRDNVFSRLREWHGGNAVTVRQASSGAVELRRNYRNALVRRRFERLRDMLRVHSLPPSRVPAFLLDNAVPFARQLMTARAVRYGERFPGMAQHLRAYGLAATAAAQWREGVLNALTDGRRLDPGSYLEVRYEDLVASPREAWAPIAGFLGIDADGPGGARLARTVQPRVVRDWRSDEYRGFLRSVEPHIRPTCEFLGYDWV